MEKSALRGNVGCAEGISSGWKVSRWSEGFLKMPVHVLQYKKEAKASECIRM